MSISCFLWETDIGKQNLNISVISCCRQEVLLLDNEIAFNEAVIEEREQGIHEIQQQIGEVNEIFKDLAVLVHEQGAMIGMSSTCLLLVTPSSAWIMLFNSNHIILQMILGPILKIPTQQLHRENHILWKPQRPKDQIPLW